MSPSGALLSNRGTSHIYQRPNQTDDLCQLIKCYLVSLSISALLSAFIAWLNVNRAKLRISVRQRATTQHRVNAKELCTKAVPG